MPLRDVFRLGNEDKKNSSHHDDDVLPSFNDYKWAAVIHVSPSG